MSGWNGATTAGAITYAVLDDLGGVVATHDGFGIFPTEEQALEALILRLESDKTEVIDKLAKAKRRKRALTRKAHAQAPRG